MSKTTRGFHIFDIPSSHEEPCRVATRAIHDKLRKPGEVIVTYVGSFAAYQGVDMLFASIPKVVRKCPEARFLIIGGDAQEIQQYMELLKRDRIEDKVTFLGKISPDLLPNYLSASDILLSPRSSGVNTPLKLLDYLKASRPIVATDIAANRQILNETVSILTAPTAESFSNGVIRLVQSRAEREKLGAAGRDLCRNHFNFDEYTCRLAACYDYVLSREGKP